MAKKENQHYVPLCYLKGFSENQLNINVYDKSLKNNFTNSIKKVAQITNFYDLPNEYIPFEAPEKFDRFIEKEFFSKIVEVEYSNLLNKVKERAKEWVQHSKPDDFLVLTADEKNDLSSYIAIQYIRRPKYRKRLWEMYSSITKQEIEILKAFIGVAHPNLKDEAKNLKISIDEQYSSVLHAQYLLNFSLLKELASAILNKIWIFQISLKQPFYTSDNPITSKAHLIDKAPDGIEGFTTEGLEIVFPLTYNICLCLLDKKHFKLRLNQTNKFEIVDDKMVFRNNMFQYFFAERQVFSYSNDFDLIKSIEKNI